MAKDGTNRGGARPGTGPKKKALVDKINEGKLEGAMILPEPAEFEGVDSFYINSHGIAVGKEGFTSP